MATEPTPELVNKIAAEMPPLSKSALVNCCARGSTRTNDGGMVDDLLSGMCSNTAEGVMNGWLVTWSMNPESRRDGYINLYTPTPLGFAVYAKITEVQ